MCGELALMPQNQFGTFRALGFIHTWLQPGAAKGEIRPKTVYTVSILTFTAFHLAEARCE
jgi:hypothetical protein